MVSGTYFWSNNQRCQMGALKRYTLGIQCLRASVPGGCSAWGHQCRGIQCLRAKAPGS